LATSQIHSVQPETQESAELRTLDTELHPEQQVKWAPFQRLEPQLQLLPPQKAMDQAVEEDVMAEA